MKDWLTISEACKHSGVSQSTLYRWLKRGMLSKYKVGVNSLRIKREELDSLLVPKRVDSRDRVSD